MAVEKENIFEGGDGFDWDSYIAFRPDYRLNNFYDMVWQYHDRHGNGKRDLAYDVGCGPGHVAEAAALEGKFATVKASDISRFHVNVARERLAQTPSATVVEVCKGEEVGKGDEGKVDLITAGECLALMDVPKAISNFGRLLASGGTLAVWYYGGPKYIGQESQEIQTLHRKITSKSFDEFKPFSRSWQMALTTIASWLDSVELPAQDWRDVQRIKWNQDLPLSYIDENQYGFKVEYKSQITEDQMVESRVDDSFWAKNVDFSFAQGFIDAQIPRQQEYKTEEVKGLYRELQQKMAGKELLVTWPVVLLLATRK